MQQIAVETIDIRNVYKLRNYIYIQTIYTMLVLDISRYAFSKITALLIRFNQVIGYAAKNVRLFVYSFVSFSLHFLQRVFLKSPRMKPFSKVSVVSCIFDLLNDEKNKTTKNIP